ncbi:MAG: ABC transporter substrate-binding protein, partial [Candidatus Krumholzibacteriia bacterium]
NRAERLVFAQLYETLVRVDCTGALQPGLASHWSATADSTVWIFALRPDARFWDGTPVTAGDVRAAWCDGAGTPGTGARVTPWDWLDARAQSVEALDARRLKVVLPEPQADLPRLLAHPATAVAVRRGGWTWPVGSGPARLRASTPPPLPEIECQANVQHPQAPAWSRLVFQVHPGSDPRDLVATGFDLAVVRALDAVRFYADLPGHRTLPLPWDRLYLLVCPPETNAAGAGRWLGAAAALDPARDVTTVAALPWPGIVFPAAGGRRCPQLAGPVAADPALRRDSDLARTPLDAGALIHDADDPGARELAGRLAALAGEGVRTAPLAAASVRAALRWQMPGAVVLAQDVQFPSGCLQLAALLAQAGWLQQAALLPGTTPPGDSLVAAHRAEVPAPDPARVLLEAGLVRPLALSRSWLICRGPLAGLALDFDGTPRLAQVGPSAAETTP